MIRLRILLVFWTVYALLVFFAVIAAAKEKIYYAELEHIEVTYFNTKYFAFFNSSARRYSRHDTTHYVSLNFGTLVPFGRNVLVHLYFYEFLSNEYRRSFVEAHYSFCDLVLKDEKLGPIIRHRLKGSTGIMKTCPFPKDVYNLANASIPNLPLLATFPFQKSRLYVNQTWNHPNGTNEMLASGHVDVHIKTRW